jgi:hypothetical protein
MSEHQIDHENRCIAFLRAGRYCEAIEVASAFPLNQISARFTYNYALAVLRSGDPVKSLAILRETSHDSPLHARLKIEALAELRRPSLLVSLLAEVIERFPSHAVDFTFFAVAELLYHRGFQESRIFIDAAVKLLSQAGFGGMVELRERRALIGQMEDALDAMLYDATKEAVYIKQKVAGPDAPQVSWGDVVAGHYSGVDSRIIVMLDGIVPSETFVEGDGIYVRGKDESRAPELPLTKDFIGFQLKGATLSHVADVPELSTNARSYLPEISAGNSIAHLGLCVTSNQTSRIGIAEGIIVPPLGDVGYFNGILNGLFSLLMWKEFFSHAVLFVPEPCHSVVKYYLDVLRAPKSQTVIGPNCDAFQCQTALCLVNEGRAIKASTLRLMQRLVRKHILIGEKSSSRRVYISRRKASQRRLLSEHEIEMTLSRLGFDILVLEDYSPVEQLARCAAAEIIVAPHGAGLTNIFACENLKFLIELMPNDYHVRGFENLARQMGATYAALFGQTVLAGSMAEMTWSIEASHLVRLLRRFGLIDASE